jgi:hypothetical protein
MTVAPWTWPSAATAPKSCRATHRVTPGSQKPRQEMYCTACWGTSKLAPPRAPRRAWGASWLRADLTGGWCCGTAGNVKGCRGGLLSWNAFSLLLLSWNLSFVPLLLLAFCGNKQISKNKRIKGPLSQLLIQNLPVMGFGAASQLHSFFSIPWPPC